MKAVRVGALILAWFGLAGPLAAQAIQGRATQEASGDPVEGAVVTALDSEGEIVTGSLTDQRGSFRLQFTRPGSYLLRLERIGFQTVESGPHEVSGTGTTVVELVASERPIELTGIVAEVDSRCVVRPEVGRATSLLWDEARKALTAAAITEAASVYRFELFSYRRTLDLYDLRIEDEQSRRSTKVIDSPIRSLPAEVLAESGYVTGTPYEGMDFYAPDANALLSDPFLADHCFTVREGREESERGLVGLGFEPTDENRGSDVEGTLWLDRESARLSHMDFRYRNIPGGVRDDRIGGRVDFEGLPNGTWIVRRWWIRMPQLARSRSPEGFAGGTSSLVVAGIVEEGSEVVEIESVTGERIADSRPGGAVRGVVFDSISGTPLSGASVIISGTRYSTVTDGAGRFMMEEVPEGGFTLAVVHPALARLSVPPLRTAVDVVRGETATLSLAVPSVSTLEARLCTESAEERAEWPVGAATLAGILKDGDSQATLQGRRLRVVWSEWELTQGTMGALTEQRVDGFDVSLGDTGSFRLCGMPPQTTLTVQVLPEDGEGAPVAEASLVLREGAWAGIEILLRGDGGEAVLTGGAIPMGGMLTAALPAAPVEDEVAETRVEELAAEGAATIEELLRQVRGVRVQGVGAGICVEPTRSTGTFGTEGRAGAGSGGAAFCRWPMLEVDGFIVNSPQRTLLDLNPGDVRSIRYLTVSEASARYGTGAQFGVLIVETYRGGR